MRGAFLYVVWALVLAQLFGAEPAVAVLVATPAPDDRRIALYTREHVQIEVFAPLSATTARVVLTNRQATSVKVEFTIESSAGEPQPYAVDLLAGETRGKDGRYVVPTGGRPAPGIVIVNVDPLPIEEASGYVRLAEDRDQRVTVTLFRAEQGGKQAYAVLVNSDDRAVTVTWQTTGLIAGPAQTFTTTLAANTVLGREGQIVLPYKPIFDPRLRIRPRVKIVSVELLRR